MRDRIERCLRGDRKALAELIELFEGTVLSYAYHLCSDPQESEDLTQETFVRAFRSLRRLQDPGRLGAWLKGICRNIHRQRLREQIREPRVIDLSEVESTLFTIPFGDDDRFFGLTAAEAFEVVAREIHTMAEPYQLVLMLRHYQGLSCREIAKRLSIPTGTVTMRLSRAHRHLRDAFRRQIDTNREEIR